MVDEIMISDELRFAERSNGIEILYACESGSRAWGFASPDSDYDVRFVYKRPIKGYLSLKRGRDTLDWMLNGDLDVNGWDLSKFLTLLRASNPTAFEWINSPIVYREHSKWVLVRNVARECFNPCASAHHYLGMAERNYHEFARGENVRLKKYLYIIRACLAAKWSVTELKPVPVPFDRLADAMLEPEMCDLVDDLVQKKREMAEIDAIPRNEALDRWIRGSLEASNERILTLKAPEKCRWGDLDDVFLDLLGL